MDRPRITIFDTTLRDGEQSPGCSMNVQEKVRLAQQLNRLGVDVIEAGFPIASDGDFEAVQRISATVRRPIIAGLARACKGDVDRAWQALQGAAHPRIHVFLATSDIHLQYKLRITREQCLEQAREAVAHAKSLCADVEFSPEDATRTDAGFLCQVVEAVIAVNDERKQAMAKKIEAAFGGVKGKTIDEAGTACPRNMGSSFGRCGKKLQESRR